MANFFEMRRRLAIIMILMLFTAAFASGQSGSPDAAEINATVERFHGALKQGDRAAALELLAPDAVILESGEIQTRAEYEREHLAEDIAFARATTTKRSQERIEQKGAAAWVIATHKTTGTFNEREIDSVGVELMVLTKDDSGWRIRAIHWSSRKSK